MKKKLLVASLVVAVLVAPVTASQQAEQAPIHGGVSAQDTL